MKGEGVIIKIRWGINKEILIPLAIQLIPFSLSFHFILHTTWIILSINPFIHINILIHLLCNYTSLNVLKSSKGI